VEKVKGLENVMSVATKTVNFIRSRGIILYIYRQFKSFLLEIEAEYSDIQPYHDGI